MTRPARRRATITVTSVGTPQRLDALARLLRRMQATPPTLTVVPDEQPRRPLSPLKQGPQ